MPVGCLLARGFVAGPKRPPDGDYSFYSFIVGLFWIFYAVVGGGYFLAKFSYALGVWVGEWRRRRKAIEKLLAQISSPAR